MGASVINLPGEAILEKLQSSGKKIKSQTFFLPERFLGFVNGNIQRQMPACVLTHGKLFSPDNEREAMEDNLTLAKSSCNKADVKWGLQAAPCYPVGTVAQQQQAGRNHSCLGEA